LGKTKGRKEVGAHKKMRSRNLFDIQVSPDKLNPNFSLQLPKSGYLDSAQATREALQEAFDILPKPDGNFIKDFQSTGFDGRIWELYLCAMFNSLDLKIAQPFDRPDFLLTKDSDSVWVEAVTANPSQVFTEETTPKEILDEFDEVAIKLGGPLTDKLKKEYWNLPHVKGKPFVLAVADFHDKAFGFRPTYNALQRYAYGRTARLVSGVGEKLEYVEDAVKEHKGRKTIPSGFFTLPGTENVSALLFSNAGTIAKFSRMGLLKKHIPGMVIMRCGTVEDQSATAIMPRAFYYLVGDYDETWNEEAVLMHNPNATHPIPSEFFRSTPQCIPENDRVSFYESKEYIFASVTSKNRVKPEDEIARAHV
jgi:hypothetical protein